MDDHRETEPGLLSSRVKNTHRLVSIFLHIAESKVLERSERFLLYSEVVISYSFTKYFFAKT